MAVTAGTRADLPLSCPRPEDEVWNMHPRVYLPIEKDGRLGDGCCFVQHEGSSVNKSRQKGPHAHSFTIDAANRFAFAADLGIDNAA